MLLNKINDTHTMNIPTSILNTGVYSLGNFIFFRFNSPRKEHDDP